MKKVILSPINNSKRDFLLTLIPKNMNFAEFVSMTVKEGAVKDYLTAFFYDKDDINEISVTRFRVYESFSESSFITDYKLFNHDEFLKLVIAESNKS